MKAGGSIAHSQGLSNNPYPRLNPIPCPDTYFSEIYSNIILPSTGKPTGEIPLGRPRRRWEDYIRMDFEEIGINAGNWVDSAQDKDY